MIKKENIWRKVIIDRIERNLTKNIGKKNIVSEENSFIKIYIWIPASPGFTITIRNVCTISSTVVPDFSSFSLNSVALEIAIFIKYKIKIYCLV